jgi:hypothetical protein
MAKQENSFQYHQYFAQSEKKHRQDPQPGSLIWLSSSCLTPTAPLTSIFYTFILSFFQPSATFDFHIRRIFLYSFLVKLPHVLHLVACKH